MAGFRSWLSKLFGSSGAENGNAATANARAAGSIAVSAETEDDALWQAVYASREDFYNLHIGQLPEIILKIGHMFGVWPGGGLFAIPPSAVGVGCWVYSTFGLSNLDMPTDTSPQNLSVERDEHGRVTQTRATLQAKLKQEVEAGLAGYGYEFLVLTRTNEDWPLWLLQWAANAELLNDVGMLNRVEQYDGLTVEDIKVGEAESVNVLIAKARPPFPGSTQLPNGKLVFLIATVITDGEMEWSMQNGRGALLERLMDSGVGQISDRFRPSIVS